MSSSEQCTGAATESTGASRSSFVGRVRELAALHEALEQAAAGQGRVVRTGVRHRIEQRAVDGTI